MRKVVITGPESTGKSTLTTCLAERLDAAFIPEYARYYVEHLGRHYNYSDIETIARYQMAEEDRNSLMPEKSLLIIDTWLILTKVWFEVVYGRFPSWLEERIHTSVIDLFLVCKPDLPWEADAVRENGGEMRNILFNTYCREIEKYGFKYELVGGIGEERVDNALRMLEKHGLILN